MLLWKNRLMWLGLATCCLFQADPAVAGSNVYVGKSKTATKSIDEIDHSIWDGLLDRHVDLRGKVDYRSWHASAQQRSLLDQYLNELSRADQEMPASRDSKLAFWINAYNAVTVKGILREYPTTSIRNHTAKLFGYNIWDDLQLYVGGAPVSLNEMEHQILRKMGEPRIHFAIVCASKSCPRLLNKAYVGDQIDQQLDTNAKHFFRQPGNFRISGNVVTLSAILDWFGEDFGNSEALMFAGIKPWVPDGFENQLRGQKLDIKYADYDWSLNE